MRPFQRPPTQSPLFFFGALAVLLAGCGWFHQDPDRETHEGEPLDIRLPANFSTGYRWVLDPPLQSARVLSEDYQPNSDRPAVGSPGTQIFRVVFPRDGYFNLKFAYRRLWEASSVPPAQTTNLVIRVRPARDNQTLMDKLFPNDTLPDSHVPQPEDEDPQTTTRKVELRKPR